MGLLVGLFFGIGLLLIVWSIAAPASSKQRSDGRLVRASRELLASAGVEGITPAAFIGACGLVGAIGLVLMYGI